MNFSIIGYGKMGKEVEKILKDRDHKINEIVTSTQKLKSIRISDSVAIDFTQPVAFKKNYKLIANKFKAVVVGTSGWNDVKKSVLETFGIKKKSLVYASNFSLSVNVFFEILNKSSELLSKLNIYEPYISELHHIHKLDAPSSTGIAIKEIINRYFDKQLLIASVRTGNLKGIHEVCFNSSLDKISIKHEATSREGFALGAVLAAEWISESPGIYNFREMLLKKIEI
jgi:4-hydroxy-tetrahydrodipicolinate reductase